MDPKVRSRVGEAYYRESHLDTDGGQRISYSAGGSSHGYTDSWLIEVLGWLFDHWLALTTLFGIIVIVILINFFVVRIF
jgi:hypothetical protein